MKKGISLIALIITITVLLALIAICVLSNGNYENTDYSKRNVEIRYIPMFFYYPR